MTRDALEYSNSCVCHIQNLSFPETKWEVYTKENKWHIHLSLHCTTVSSKNY